MKLTFLVPVFNEVATVKALLERLDAVQLGEVEKELVVVDDGSTDGTTALLRGLPEQLFPHTPWKRLFHEKNRGKGAAIRTALTAATGEVVVVQDADLEYDPNDLKPMLETLQRDNLQVIYGSRFLHPDNRRHSSYAAYVGGRTLTFITNVLYGTHLTDEPTCYKMFRRELLAGLDLKCERFEFCPEVTAKVALRGIPIPELPITYRPRHFADGKKIRPKDFFEAIRVLVRERAR